jgi:Tol biopolymer transport system component
MKLGRRAIVLLSGLVLLGLAAAALVFAVVRDEGDHPYRYPGRIAVREGCGLRHTFFDGKDQKQLCLPKLWAAVSVSWNGKRIAWDTGTGITIANSDGFDPVEVTLPLGANFDPSLSPDGDKVAFLHSSRDDGRYDLWVGSTSIDNAEQLTAMRDISSVAWSPAGDRIAYVRGWSETTLEGAIMLIRPDGSDAQLLARGDAPTWAPGGSRLAFAHDEGIWTIGANGSNLQKLIANGESPAWSRDGKMIAFVRALSCGKPVCKQRVFIVGATGGAAHAVGPAFDGPRSPVWLPDPFE